MSQKHGGIRGNGQISLIKRHWAAWLTFRRHGIQKLLNLYFESHVGNKIFSSNLPFHKRFRLIVEDPKTWSPACLASSCLRCFQKRPNAESSRFLRTSNCRAAIFLSGFCRAKDGSASSALSCSSSLRPSSCPRHRRISTDPDNKNQL
jgi:hypothetical protein